jgi:hypothetical protein
MRDVARPTTKVDLENASYEKYQLLMQTLDAIPEEAKTAPFTFDISKQKEAHWKRDKNIRDVLIHLYEWQQLLLKWVEANVEGERKPFLKEGYNWKTYGAMNQLFWEKHQQTEYTKALTLLKESHHQVMQLMEPFSNDELFRKGAVSWSGGTTLGSYFISTTSSHYDWAIKKLKKHQKSVTYTS